MLENFPNLTFVDFLISWWSSLIVLNILMILDFWIPMLTKKSKFDFWVTVDFSSVDSILQLSITCIFGNVLSHVIRSRCCIWVLEIMFQAIRSCTRPIVNDQSSSVKTLILTIFYLWWFEGFPWRIMVNPWSNYEYHLKMLMLTKKYWSLTLCWA